VAAERESPDEPGTTDLGVVTGEEEDGSGWFGELAYG